MNLYEEVKDAENIHAIEGVSDRLFETSKNLFVTHIRHTIVMRFSYETLLELDPPPPNECPGWPDENIDSFWFEFDVGYTTFGILLIRNVERHPKFNTDMIFLNFFKIDGMSKNPTFAGGGVINVNDDKILYDPAYLLEESEEVGASVGVMLLVMHHISKNKKVLHA